MGKLNIFEICFANQSGIFYSGNIIDGQVVVELTEPMKMRGIQLKFHGQANVRWTESQGSGKSRHTRTYSAMENYFDQDVLLFGIWQGQGSNTTELPTGRHSFPFRYQLPMGLPSSFEGAFGRVRYQVSAKIDKPWKFDHKTKHLFSVISILDLNTETQYCQRVSFNKQKHLCCLCCKSGPISAQFSIERQGYVPGEAIKLYADISNGSSRTMDNSYVNLTMVTKFHATSKTRTTSKEVARVTRPMIRPFGEDTWSGMEQLVIPPLPPSFLVGCNIIDIQYVLQLNVNPSGPALDLEVPLGVFIGTIPLMSVVQQAPPMPPPFQYGVSSDPNAPHPPPQALYPNAPPSTLPNMPPPSYSECITGRVDTRDEDDNAHTRGNLEFAPVYTYYNWGHTTSGVYETETKKL